MTDKQQLKALLKGQIDTMVDKMEELKPGFEICQLRLIVNDGCEAMPAISTVIRTDNHPAEGDAFWTETFDMWQEVLDGPDEGKNIQFIDYFADEKEGNKLFELFEANGKLED